MIGLNKAWIIIVFLIFAISVMIPGASLATKTFTVTAQEQGLPTNTLWTGFLTNHTFTWSISTTAFSESFSIPNGTYQYQFNDTASYIPLNANGYFTVNNGTYTLVAQYVPVNSNTTYAITFIPVNLGTGVNWTLNINGLSYTQNKSVTLNLLTANYSFSASAPGYAFNTSYVFVTHNESVNVSFYKQQYQGISGSLNQFFMSVFGISLTMIYIILGLIIGLILGFYVMIRTSKMILFVVPVLIIFLTGLVLSILPLWVAVVLFLFAGSYIVLPLVFKEGIGNE